MKLTRTVTKAQDGAAPTEALVLSRTAYDFAKQLVQIILPALASLYFGLSQIWGLPAGEEVVGTISLITVFLGTLIGISSNRFYNSDAPYDGQMVVEEDPGGIAGMMLELDDNIELLGDKETIAFRVKRQWSDPLGANPQN